MGALLGMMLVVLIAAVGYAINQDSKVKDLKEEVDKFKESADSHLEQSIKSQREAEEMIRRSKQLIDRTFTMSNKLKQLSKQKKQVQDVKAQSIEEYNGSNLDDRFDLFCEFMPKSPGPQDN